MQDAYAFFEKKDNAILTYQIDIDFPFIFSSKIFENTIQKPSHQSLSGSNKFCISSNLATVSEPYFHKWRRILL